MELWRLDRGTFKEVVVSSTMATRKRREDFLSKVPVLVTMSPAEISALADNAMEIEFPEGTTLMEEGEKCVFFLLSKTLRETINRQREKKSVLAFFQILTQKNLPNLFAH